jgi:hypothetical protein
MIGRLAPATGGRTGGLLGVAALLAVLAACGGQSPTSPGPSTPAPVDNVLPVEVTSGPAGNTVNGLYASVTICVPGTASCQTIDGVQVDTGSIGLRLLASAVTLPLPAIAGAGGQTIGNCVSYADQSYTWGQVVTADIQLGGEKASAVPIQVIGAPGLAPAPAECSNGGMPADTTDALSARGLLGLGLFRQDCGAACSGGVSPPPPVYFACAGGHCSATSVPLASQLQNPAWLFPQDNNGLVVSLPAVPATGMPILSGSLVFGVGTQANNALGSARVYTTTADGNITTTFNGTAYPESYLDTGSNGLYFLDDATIGLPPCPGENSLFSCPDSTVDYSATNVGANGASAAVSFSIANAESLFATGNDALVNLGGPDSGDFDWGLPFFFGRTTFIGIEGQRSSAATGPYWAY